VSNEPKPGHLIREVLRRAGYRERAGGRSYGFIVEGGEEGGPCYLAYVDRPGDPLDALTGCAAALREAGYQVMRDLQPPHGLEVWRPNGSANPVMPPRWRRRLLKRGQ
jgi:hypothetical protein